MEASSRKRLSLDTNVLFDLADRKDFAHDFREAYQRKGYALVIPPTVVAELYFLRSLLCPGPKPLKLSASARSPLIV